MYEEQITIDVDRLRADMKSECLGAYFGGGFGAALVEASDISSASPEKLVNMALNSGVDIMKYRV